MRTRMWTAILLVLALGSLSTGGSRPAGQAAEPDKFFRDYVGLSDDQIAAIRKGKAIAKIMESRIRDEVFVFGSVYITSTPERYLRLASDMDALRKLPSYLAIRRFSDPPELSDLAGFTLEEQDIKQLKNCKPGHCEVQLATKTMETFQQSVNWSAPDAPDQVNHLAQQLALQALLRYKQGGNTALGTYRDKNHPAEVAEIFTSLLSRSKALPVYLPDLNRYLLEYPNVKLENVETEFYWEKVNFGHGSERTGIRRCRETALCQPLLRNRSGSIHLRQRRTTPQPGWLLPDYSEGLSTGRDDRTERRHRAQGGGR